MKISHASMAAVAAATIVAAGVGSAKASSLFGPGGSITGPSGPQNNVNQILYHNYENVFDSNGNRISATTPLAPGDYIVGILNVDQISPPGTTVGGTFGTSGSPAGEGEVTGIFAQKVLSISGSTPGSIITFGTSDKTTFVDGLTAGGPTTINTGLAAGAMFAFYQDNSAGGNPAIPFAATGSGVTLASSILSATNGTSLFTLGLGANAGAGDPNTGYFYSVINNLNPANLAINGFGGLNFLTNNTGNLFNTIIDTSATQDPNDAVGFIIESSVTPNNTTPSPWDFASHDPADVSVFIPIPATVWTGLSMLAGMGCIAALRRRKAVLA